MPQFYKVTLNGHPLRLGMTRAEADAMAQRWQGSHANGSGLLKIKDRGDWVEVKRDHDAERDWDERYARAKAGDRQVIHYISRKED